MRGRERVTRHIYDASGRMVRSITEPEWTVEDRAEALAYQAYVDDLHPRCGQPLSISTNIGKSGDYEIEYAGECLACAEWAAWEKAHKGSPNYQLYRLVDHGKAFAVDLPEQGRPAEPPQGMTVDEIDEALSGSGIL